LSATLTKRRRELDFETLPIIESMDIFARFPSRIEEEFQNLSFLKETYERARSALMFIFQANEDDESWRNDARLRAGLNEFYSMEDAARRDVRRANLKRVPSTIAESRSPLVHLMYILRHVNVHTQAVASRVQEISVTSRLGGEEREFSYGAVIISTISLRDLQRSRDAVNYYQPTDLERALDWLLTNQQAFGISEVFRAGISRYCDELFESLI
jgi:hypothetical protein